MAQSRADPGEVAELWREAGEHWANVDAFIETMRVVSADRVIGLEESKDLCYKAPQWRRQLDAVQGYVVEFRALDSELVDKTPRLHKLETEADRALVVVAALEEDCQ